MTTNTIKGLTTILNYIKDGNADKPFYASDLGLNGAQIQCLHFGDSDDFQFIAPTGNTKEIFIYTGYANNYKQVTVKEWKVATHHWSYGSDVFFNELSKAIDNSRMKLREQLEAYGQMAEILKNFHD